METWKTGQNKLSKYNKYKSSTAQKSLDQRVEWPKKIKVWNFEKAHSALPSGSYWMDCVKF